MILGYLGPELSYSRLAAVKFRPIAEFKEYKTFPAMFSALKKGECDYIAVPIENSLNGGVLQNIDLLQNSKDVFAVEECVVKIEHRLATLAGADPKKITRIYSHEQALAQCALFLAENYPEAELVAAPSTSAGLKMVKSESEGAIVGAHVCEEGFTLSTYNIADESQNFTHFLLVRRGGREEGVHSKKIFISATCRHKSGALLSLLEPIREGGLNMTKIESRPIKDSPGEYRFFIEMEGDICTENAICVLKNIEKEAFELRILGCY